MRDDPAGLEQEHRKQRALLRAAELDGLAVSASLERTEDGEFDQRGKVVAPAQAASQRPLAGR